MKRLVRIAKYLVYGSCTWLLVNWLWPVGFHRDHLHITRSTSILADRTGRFAISVPLHNGGRWFSRQTTLQVNLEYQIFDNCSANSASPATKTCYPPQTCTETLLFDVPALRARSFFSTPKTYIGPETGACACTLGNCAGKMHYKLAAPDGINTSQVGGWGTDGYNDIVTYIDEHFRM
jgi:hypothetical protein